MWNCCRGVDSTHASVCKWLSKAMLSQHESEKWEVAVIAFICPLQTSWTYTQRWERRGAESISAQATHTSIHTHADEIWGGGGV